MSRLIDTDVLVKRICGEKCGCTKNSAVTIFAKRLLWFMKYRPSTMWTKLRSG